MEGIAGVHVMAIEWEEKLEEIVGGAGLLPRPTVNLRNTMTPVTKLMKEERNDR